MGKARDSSLRESPDSQTQYLDLMLRSERWIGLPSKALLLVAGILAQSSGESSAALSPLTIGAAVYGLASLLLAYLIVLRPLDAERIGRRLFFTSYGFDIALSGLIIYHAGATSDSIFLFVLLALKSVLYYPLWREIIVFPLSLGPLCVMIMRLSLGTWRFLADPYFQTRYALLLTMVLASFYLSWLNERNQQLEGRLRRNLAERTTDLDNKTRTMQQMATSLGNRVLELRTLQEGIQAINSALALEDVLRLIVANASQVLEGARCSVALLDQASDRVTSTAASDGRTAALAEFDEDVVSWMADTNEPLMVGDLHQDDRLRHSGSLPLSSVIGVPLLLDSRVIGALIATSVDANAFSTEDANLLNAFADQAVVAVKNARLYEQLIQEQRETERVYQHAQERRNELEAIVRAIGDAVIVADPELNLLLMNPVATRIFGVRSDVTSSVPLSQVIPHPELNELLRSALSRKEGSAVQEILLPVGDGKLVSTHQALASLVLGADGLPRGVVTVLRDITNQKELERMKSSFLSVVSHELRTPLHSIKGFVDIILMGKTGELNDTQTDFLRTVRQQTTHLQNLIDDLLEYSRLESGQVKMRLSKVPLTEVAAAVTEKLKPLADQGQIRLECKLPARLPPIEADRLRIEQVLTNLVDNAIKFTPASGSITILGKDLGGEIQVSVTDTGIGIPQAELERIFDRFYQVDGGSSRPYRGTGLGLTICKHIIEHHHGRIWAESEPNKGSTFHFVLPKRLADKDGELLLDFLALPEKPRKRNTNSSH